MGSIIVNLEIKAPVELVFQKMTDIDRWADTISGITEVEKLTDGPIGVGTRWKETRIMFGKQATEEMEITEFVPNQMYTVESISCGTLYRTEIRCRPSGQGTIATMDMHTKPLTLMAKLMSPLGWAMSGMMKKFIAKDLHDIKESIEGNAQTAAESP